MPVFAPHTPRSALAVLSGTMILSLGAWGVSDGISFAAAAAVPAVVQTPAAAEVVEISTSTVRDIIALLPQTDRFDLLLYNSGVGKDLAGPGYYIVLAPQNNYFDYLAPGTISHLTRQEAKELARNHVRESLPEGVTVLKEYRGANGVVYVIDTVLMPPQ